MQIHQSIGTVLGVVGLCALAFAAGVGRTADANGDGCVDLKDHAAMQTQFTGPDCTPREIMSFLVKDHVGGNVSVPLIPSVPGENGFIVTDVVLSGLDLTHCGDVQIGEQIGMTFDVKIRVGLQDGRTFHWQSGVPLDAGTVIAVKSSSFCRAVQISGYTY